MLSLRVVSFKSNRPDKGESKYRSNPNDPSSELVTKQVDIPVATTLEDLKTEFIKTFEVDWVRPTIVAPHLYDTRDEPVTSDRNFEKIVE
eukprot:3934191-Rhodomonas_salina.1